MVLVEMSFGFFGLGGILYTPPIVFVVASGVCVRGRGGAYFRGGLRFFRRPG